MDAWVVQEPGPIDTGPLRRVSRTVPEPGPSQLLVRVVCCGVCRTDLHLSEGDLPPKRAAVTPGHEVVGLVEGCGEQVARFAVGDRVGVAWLGRTDGSCRFCRRGEENLCLAPAFTGWHLDGGYADFCLVDEAFGYALPGTSRRRAGSPAALRRDHRLSGAAAVPRCRPAVRWESTGSAAAPI